MSRGEVQTKQFLLHHPVYSTISMLEISKQLTQRVSDWCNGNALHDPHRSNPGLRIVTACNSCGERMWSPITSMNFMAFVAQIASQYSFYRLYLIRFLKICFQDWISLFFKIAVEL